MPKLLIILQTHILLALFFSAGYSQSLTNLEKLYQAADSSISIISNDAGTGNCLKVNTPGLYSVFSNTILKTAGTKGLPICKANEDSVLSYIIENAFIKYPVMFRDGFLGRYLVRRDATLEGNYYSSGKGYLKISITSSDTIAVEDIKDLENEALPFTKGELPTEPFFSGILEPVAALTAAAAIIVLYFTVRSR